MLTTPRFTLAATLALTAGLATSTALGAPRHDGPGGPPHGPRAGAPAHPPAAPMPPHEPRFFHVRVDDNPTHQWSDGQHTLTVQAGSKAAAIRYNGQEIFSISLDGTSEGAGAGSRSRARRR